MIVRLLGVLCGACVASTAHAHVVFSTNAAKAGSYHVAELRIFHGCEGSPTQEVTIEMPKGLLRVRPRAAPGWEVSVSQVELDEPVLFHGFEVTESVGSITWTGGDLPDFAYQQFDVHFLVPEAPGEVLSFPVRQKCAEGRLDWVEKALDEDAFRTLTMPAPFIEIVE